MVAAIASARNDGDSVGGVVRCVVRGVPAGWGDPVFDKLTATECMTCNCPAPYSPATPPHAGPGCAHGPDQAPIAPTTASVIQPACASTDVASTPSTITRHLFSVPE